MIDTNEDIKNFSIARTAERWIGTRETEATKGQLLIMCHEALGKTPNDTPWCMLFVQYCIKMSEENFKSIRPSEPWISSPLFPSNNCLITWEHSPKQQIPMPIKGSLCIWQKFDGITPLNNGHIGVVIDINSNGAISVVEANTRSTSSNLIPGYDGMNLFTYRQGKTDQGTFKFKGFLKAW